MFFTPWYVAFGLGAVGPTLGAPGGPPDLFVLKPFAIVFLAALLSKPTWPGLFLLRGPPVAVVLPSVKRLGD